MLPSNVLFTYDGAPLGQIEAIKSIEGTDEETQRWHLILDNEKSPIRGESWIIQLTNFVLLRENKVILLHCL